MIKPINNSAGPAAPADFHGYLALILTEGEAPGLYRVERIVTDYPEAICEDCSKEEEHPGEPFYRWIELADVAWPLHLSCCHECMVSRYWAKRFQDTEPADGVGDRMHIYSPIDPATRAGHPRR